MQYVFAKKSDFFASKKIIYQTMEKVEYNVDKSMHFLLKS